MNPRSVKLLILLAAFLLGQVRSSSGDARRLADLNPGAVGSYPSNLTAFAGQLFFSAYTLTTGIELWRWDGTGIQLVADINDTADDIGGGIREGNDSVPHGFTRYGGALYFTAYDSQKGGELWRTDGTNVSRLTDIAQDNTPTGKSSWPNELTVYNDSLYFSATSTTNPLNYELWRYHTNSGAALVADLRPNTGNNHGSYPNKLKVFDNALYFMADDGTHGWELWKHTPNGTTLIDINPGDASSSSYPKFFTAYSNHLYFQAYTSAEGFELWRTDGTNTAMVADLNPGAESSFPENFTTFNNALYFRGTDPALGSELLRFDGIQISVAADIHPTGSSYPKNLFVYRGALLFTADDGVNGWELWKYDGVNASIITNLNDSGDAFPENLTVSDGILYFTAAHPATGYELWSYDGTNVTLAADLDGSQISSYPRFLTSANRKLYFSAPDTTDSNWELWMYDPSFTNHVPMITLGSPTNNSVFNAGEPVIFSATASDDFEVISVEFFVNEISLGIDDSAPYTATNNFTVGDHTIFAKAIDTSGAITVTPAVTITVQESPIQPPQLTHYSRVGNLSTIRFAANTTHSFVLESSSDLMNWSPVDSQPPVDGTVSFTHAADSEYLFYRVSVP
jgi:ELWxxDGT repeat protein